MAWNAKEPQKPKHESMASGDSADATLLQSNISNDERDSTLVDANVVKAEEKRDSSDASKDDKQTDITKAVPGNVKQEPNAIPSVKQSLLPDSPSPSPLRTPLKDVEDEEGDDEAGKNAVKSAERDQERSGSSRLNSPDDVKRSARKKSANVRWSSVGPTQTAEHLPVARDQAMQTFTEIKSNNYQHTKVGRSKGHEKDAMVCECRYQHGIDDPMMACGEDGACINRLTQVECRESDCNCGKYCRNQRFQKHQYADVEIVQTDKKGFGLRSKTDLSADAFIYEYIGEVVQQDEFMSRMQRYKDEGIRHYYFMMLQREEFIDATKKGGVARFINHSCNPNCYVSKWHVGKHMRMGIFSKRAIVENEELTFNYNVDRYGNEAQPCYCGEPNCVGAIGGKTQTDIGGMDQLFLDALGIADEVDRIGARGTRKSKSRHLDDEDFNPTLHPMQEDEVAKVMTAVRQAASNRIILRKLLSRIHMTEDAEVQRSLVRLHGFALMAAVLDEWKDDKEILLLTMGSLARWPLIARNKVVDSGVDTLVKDFSSSDDEQIRSLAVDLLSAWDALEMSYRIARREAKDSTQQPLALDRRRVDDTDDVAPTVTLQEAKAPNSVSTRLSAIAPKPLLNNVSNATGSTRYSSSGFGQSGNPQATRQRQSRVDGRRIDAQFPSRASQPSARPSASIEQIIRNANEAAAAQRKKAEEEATAKLEAAAKAEEARKNGSSSSSLKRRPSSIRTTSSSADKKRRTSSTSAGKRHSEPALEQAEHTLKKLVGDVVVRAMSSFKDELERDLFKQHAKELTKVVLEKEKRNPKVWPPRIADGAKFMPDGFSSEKRGKIKNFANDYIRKLIAHKRAKANGNASVSASASQSSSTLDKKTFGADEKKENEGDGDDSRAQSDRGIVDNEDDDDMASIGSSNHDVEATSNHSPASGSHFGGDAQFLGVRHDHASASTASTATTTSTDQAAPATPRDTNIHPTLGSTTPLSK